MWCSLLQRIFPTPGLNPGLPHHSSPAEPPEKPSACNREIQRRQTLLEKWHRWTCLTQGCYKPSICKHSLRNTIRWSAVKQGLPAYMCVLSRSAVSHSLRPLGLWPARLLCPWDSPSKKPGAGCHLLLQGMMEHVSPMSPTLAGFFTTHATQEAHQYTYSLVKCLFKSFAFKKKGCQTSLVAQWIRIHLPMKGTWVPSLVQEDSTWCGTTKPLHNN